MIDVLPPPLISFLLGGAPISEVRGAAIYSFGVDNPLLMVFGMVGNMLAAIALLVLWDLLNIEEIGRRIVGKRLDKLIERYHKTHELGETIALAIFIGIPLPVTGVYTGILLGKILRISNWKILTASAIGILIASLIMYLALSGIVSFLSFFT
jgi:uncharacterized membrane protein